MYVQNVDDAVYCRFFLATLKGVAQSWFNGLSLRIISCFQDLADRFVSPFHHQLQRKANEHPPFKDKTETTGVPSRLHQMLSL